MALNWFKKKKNKQEEKIDSDQKLDNASEALETEDVADTQANENNVVHEQQEEENC